MRLSEQIQVRTGPEMRGSDIGGIAVHAAAPVMAQCQSNEILVSLGRDRPCRRRGPEVLRRSSGRHVKPGASAAATGYRDIVPRGGRRTLAGKTEYRAVADRTAAAVPARHQQKRPATIFPRY